MLVEGGFTPQRCPWKLPSPCFSSSTVSSWSPQWPLTWSRSAVVTAMDIRGAGCSCPVFPAEEQPPSGQLQQVRSSHWCLAQEGTLHVGACAQMKSHRERGRVPWIVVLTLATSPRTHGSPAHRPSPMLRLQPRAAVDSILQPSLGPRGWKALAEMESSVNPS